MEGDRCFSRVYCDMTWGNVFELKEGRFRLDIRRRLFTVGVVRHWNRLPREVVEAPSLETFKVSLSWLWASWSSCRCPCSFQGSWIRWPLKVSSNSNNSMTPWFPFNSLHSSMYLFLKPRNSCKITVWKNCTLSLCYFYQGSCIWVFSWSTSKVQSSTLLHLIYY